MTWFRETVRDAFQQSLRIDRLLYRGKTAYQSVEIFENSLFGRGPRVCFGGTAGPADPGGGGPLRVA